MEDRNYRFVCFDRNHRNLSSYQDVYNKSLEGEWIDENGRIDLNIKSNGTMTMMVLDFAEEDRVDVNVKYSIDKDDKIITIHQKIRSLRSWQKSPTAVIQMKN